MTENLVIASGHVVTIHYTLTDEAGQIIQSTRSGEPLRYVQGGGKLVPGLEKQLNGRRVGDRFLASIAPADGFGEYIAPGPQPISRSAFPDDADLTEGAKHRVKSDTGDEFDVWVKRTEDDVVYVDSNHPYAGVTLNFDVEVFSIRPATDSELASGEPS